MIRVPIEKLSPELHELYNLSALKNLNVDQLAAFVGTSSRNIYRWFHGKKPVTPFRKMIAEAVVRIKAECPGPNSLAEVPEHGIASWGKCAVWELNEDPDAIKAEEDAQKKFGARMTEIFYELQRKMRPEEIELLVQEVPAWTGLVEMLPLLKKYGFKLPKL